MVGWGDKLPCALLGAQVQPEMACANVAFVTWTVGVSKTPHPTDSSEADLYSQADVRGALIRVEI